MEPSLTGKTPHLSDPLRDAYRFLISFGAGIRNLNTEELLKEVCDPFP